MRRLGRRLSRFERLVDLGAPQVIIDDGRRMIHEALAEVEKEDGEAVMADFPRAESLLATNEEKRAAAARARAKSKAN
jgi:type IV secretory pathway VirB9-like protein